MRLSPFRALRPADARVEEVACPPYDVISTAEARALAEGKPGSFLHVIRPEINLPKDGDEHKTDLHEEAARQLSRLTEQGALIEETKEALWLYRLVMGERAQVGIVGCADVDAYEDDSIKKHELTRPDKEDDRTRHVHTVGAHTGPVFLACKSTPGLRAMQEEWMGSDPIFDFIADDDIRHTLWRITDPRELERASAQYAALDAFYIADGHHRAASAKRVRDLRRAERSTPASTAHERFLVVVFPEDQLKILAYNRVVADLNGLSHDQFLAALTRHFEVGPPGADPIPSCHRSFCLYLNREWRTLRALAHVVDETDVVARLDVALLQNLVLSPILGIHDPRTDQRISFVGGIRGTKFLEQLADDGGDGSLAFSMFPTSIQELFAVADSGSVMPPKSTWFEPKLRSGLLVHPIV